MPDQEGRSDPEFDENKPPEERENLEVENKSEEPVETPEEQAAREYIQNCERLEKEADEYIAQHEIKPKLEAIAEKTTHPPPEPVLNLGKIIQRNKTSSVVKSARDFIRRMSFSIQGVRDPEKLVAFANYLESTVKNHDFVDTKVKRTKLSQKMLEFNSPSYSPYIVGKPDKKKVAIRHEIEFPYKFQIKDTKKVESLLNQANDPVETLERLKRAGFHITGHDFGYRIDELKKLVSSPEVLSALKRIEQIGLQGYYWLGKEDLKALQDLAQRDANERILDETNIQKIKTISKILERKLMLGDIADCAELVRGQKDFELFQNLIEGRFPYEVSMLFKNFGIIRESDLVEPLHRLSQSNIDISDSPVQGLFDLDITPARKQAIIRGIKEFTESEQSKELLNNQPLLEFAKKISALRETKISLKDINKYKELQLSPETVPVFELFRRWKLDTSYEWGHEFENLKAMLSDKEMMKDFLKPEFSEFVISLQEKLGYKLSKYDIVYKGKPRGLMNLFNNPEQREAILSPVAIEIVKAQGAGLNLDRIENYVALTKVPNILEIIRGLKQNFGYELDLVHHEEIAELSEFTFEQLCGKEVLEFFNALKSHGLPYEFSPRDAAKLISLARDKEFHRELFAKDNLKFIKEAAQFDNIGELQALTLTDQKIRPLALRLAKNFNYKYKSPRYSEHRDRPGLIDLLERKEELAKLFSPKQIALFKKMRENLGVGSLELDDLGWFLILPEDFVEFVNVVKKMSGYYFVKRDAAGLLELKDKGGDKLLALLGDLKENGIPFKLNPDQNNGWIELIELPKEKLIEKIKLLQEKTAYKFDPAPYNVEILALLVKKDYQLTDFQELDSLLQERGERLGEKLSEINNESLWKIRSLVAYRENKDAYNDIINRFKKLGIGCSPIGDHKQIQDILDNNMMPPLERLIPMLQQYGYRFGFNHLKLLFELTKRTEQLEKALTGIKQINPEFKYSPNLDRSDMKFKADPYLLLAERYLQKMVPNFDRQLWNEKLNSENWSKFLTVYIAHEEQLFTEGEMGENIREAFSQNNSANRDLCLNKLRDVYQEYLKNNGAKAMPPEINLLLAEIEEAGGAGNLKYIGLLGGFMHELRQQAEFSDLSPEARQDIFQGLLRQEERFGKERWDEDEKSQFYAISRDIFHASPLVYREFFKIFENLRAKDLSAFAKKSLPLYQARLVLLQNEQGIIENSPDLINLQKHLVTAGGLISFHSPEEKKGIFQEINQELIQEIQKGFKQKFGLLKTPEDWDAEKIRFVQNFVRYLGNMNERDPIKENLIALYLGLNINEKWSDFRRGEELDLNEYFGKERASVIQNILEQQNRSDPLKTEALKISGEELKEFQKILQDETMSQFLGNVETIDIKLGNLVRNIEDLADEDIYPLEKDKRLLRLFSKYGKNVNSALGKAFKLAGGASIELSPEESGALDELKAIYKAGGFDRDSIKTIQDQTKAISLVTNTVGKIKGGNVEMEIAELQSRLEPPPPVIEIFNKLGEDFKPESGALALSQDLTYLENIIVKNEKTLSDDEQKILRNYLGGIRRQMQSLEQTYQTLTEQADKIRKSTHSSNNEILQSRLEDIDKIIQAKTSQTQILSHMTNNFNLIIENMRQCLGCLRKEINNDTNLTFGESYKFYLMSQGPEEKGSIADEIVLLCPVKGPDDEQEMSFVLDRAYGNKSADILISHITAVLKKTSQLKTRFPETRLSVFVTQAAMSSVGLNHELLMNRLKKLDIKNEQMASAKAVEVNVPQSALGDHYVEFGDKGARQAGDRTTDGLFIR